MTTANGSNSKTLEVESRGRKRLGAMYEERKKENGRWVFSTTKWWRVGGWAVHDVTVRGGRDVGDEKAGTGRRRGKEGRSKRSRQQAAGAKPLSRLGSLVVHHWLRDSENPRQVLPSSSSSSSSSSCLPATPELPGRRSDGLTSTSMAVTPVRNPPRPVQRQRQRQRQPVYNMQRRYNRHRMHNILHRRECIH